MNKLRFATIFLLIASLSLSAIVTKPAEAASLSDILESITSIDFGIGKLVEVMVDAVVEVAKKQFLDLVVDQIVISIQGGGQPQFVSDWKSFLGNYVNIATGSLVQELGLGFVCSPFGLQLQLAVLRPPLFSNQITCTLDQIVGNIASFYENFRTGGFIAYQEIWQPQNNFYGALLLAMDEKNKRIARDLYAATQEAVTGSGYLGIRKCDETGRFCYIETPGTQVGALAAKAYGSKIDYLLDAKTFGGYVAAITDAFIVRLSREGIGAFRQSAASLPSISQLAGGEDRPELDPCRGLEGEFLIHCRTNQAIHQNDFDSTQRNLIQQIKLTLLPATAASNSLIQAGQSQGLLVDRLRELRTCRINRGQSGQQEITAELLTEEAAANQLTQGLIEIQEITVPLLNAKLHLENPPAKTIFALAEIFAPIEFLLSPIAANSRKETARAEQQAIRDKVGQRLPQVQQAIQQCVTS